MIYKNKKITVKLVSSSTWHDIFLKPIAEELKNRGYNIELFLGVNEFGSFKDTIAITSYHMDIPKCNGATKIFFLEHAVSTLKSAYAHKEVGLADYVLVQGEIFSNWLSFCHPNIKQLKTGWHRIEKLYNKLSTKDKIIKKHNLDKDKPIILYLPTWDNNRKYKRNGTFEEAFPILDSLGYSNLLTLPHKSCIYANSTYLDHPKIIRNAETYDYLLAADLLIGDTSSILIESSILDIPIIHINKWNNLDGYINWFYDGSCKITNFKHLFGIFQLGQIVTLNKKKIKEAIQHNLSYPNKYRYIRNYYTNVCFYNLGNSLKTSIDDIEKIINKEGSNE